MAIKRNSITKMCQGKAFIDDCSLFMPLHWTKQLFVCRDFSVERGDFCSMFKVNYPGSRDELTESDWRKTLLFFPTVWDADCKWVSIHRVLGDCRGGLEYGWFGITGWEQVSASRHAPKQHPPPCHSASASRAACVCWDKPGPCSPWQDALVT